MLSARWNRSAVRGEVNQTVGIIDYGMGNLQSVKNACEYLGARVSFIRSERDFEGITHVILPGVGAFGQGMKNLQNQCLVQPICRKVTDGHTRLLGICLGMQLLAEWGTEGGTHRGLGLVQGTVKRLEDRGLRVPHIGWNNVKVLRENALVPRQTQVDYYFVHSYYLDASQIEDVAAICEYGINFPCVVEKGYVQGVQFHPEKSHRSGLTLLENFLRQSC